MTRKPATPLTRTDADALLAAVWADPRSDTPRLVYADYLNESGDPGRAEFIRLQVERARAEGAGGEVPDAPRASAGPVCSPFTAPSGWPCPRRTGWVSPAPSRASAASRRRAQPTRPRAPQPDSATALTISGRYGPGMAEWAAGLIAGLATSPASGRLVELDLGATRVTAGALPALAGSMAFARLRSLRLGGGTFAERDLVGCGPGIVAALRAAFAGRLRPARLRDSR